MLKKLVCLTSVLSLLVSPIFNTRVQATPSKSLSSETYYLGGKVVLIENELDNPYVVNTLDKCVFRINDIIKEIYIDDMPYDCKTPKDLDIISNQKVETVSVVILRDNKEINLNINPLEFKKALFTNKRSILGTITAIKEDGSFIGLGHASKIGGNLVPIKKAKVLDIGSVKFLKGKGLNIGSLVTDQIGEEIGYVDYMDSNGIGGVLTNKEAISNKKIETGSIKKGQAYIYCINPTTYKHDYHEINIVGINDKSIVFEVVDNDIKEKLNGIVGGMSGSPVIQDGKLVGSVKAGMILNKKCGVITDINDMKND